MIETRIKTQATTKPVSLDLFKQHMRVTHNHEDTLYKHYLDTAIRVVENATSVALQSTVFEQVQDCFTKIIELRRAPMTTVASVKYYDSDNALQTLDPSKYVVDVGAMEVGMLWPSQAANDIWPDTYSRRDAVVVEYTAGYVSQDAVPADAISAILMLGTHFNIERAPVSIGNTTTELPLTVRTLLASMSIGRYEGVE